MSHELPASANCVASGPIERSFVREVAPSLDIAARSIVESHALQATIASVVDDRALDHHWEGLFQYGAIRVGVVAAARLLGQLECEMETAQFAHIEGGCGARANLYARLRALIAATPPAALAPDSVMFWRSGDERLHDILSEFRRALTAESMEIIELHFARRLSADEIAYAIGARQEAVLATLEHGVRLATRMLGRRPPSRDPRPEGALLEAFALDPGRARCPRRRARRPVLQIGQVVAERYEIEALLGSGAFADVYRARDRDVYDHVVALKILRRRSADSSSVQAALRELQLIASVFHPSIVQLKNHGWHDGRLWFVAPLYRGETLARRLERGALSRREARDIFEPLAEALATMHRAGVRHQDIKPENVFLAQLDPDPESPQALPRLLPVLLDLGVAAKDAELVLAGTPAYFAPEVAARFVGIPDPPSVGPKADVFSLALTLRHALDPEPTEHVAAGAVDAFVAFRATHTPPPPWRRELRDLRPYFERWLHLSLDERPSAEELRRELATLTRREEHRARRLSVMRWAVPTGLAVLAVFAAVVYGLSREASLRRIEATQALERAAQARQRAASFHVSLSEQSARRRALEADVLRLENQYQSSRMTREQMAARLAQAEGELATQADRNGHLSQRLRTRGSRDEHARAVSELENANTRIRQLSAELHRERARREDAEANAVQVRDVLTATQSNLESARSRLGELQSRFDTLRRSLGLLPWAVAGSHWPDGKH